MGNKYIYFSVCYMSTKSYLFKCSSNLLYLKKSFLSACSINYRRIWISLHMTINFFSFRFAGFFFKYSTIISLSGDSYCKESACNSPREGKYIYERERERKDSVMNHLYTSSRFSRYQSYVTHASSIPFIVLG